MQLQFVQSDGGNMINNLGKGIIYLNENRIIKNIRLKEINAFWIVYEKDGNLHDKLMEEINHIEFPEAKPEPVSMQFENKKPVLKKLMNNTI
jgi:hypothetical protein